VSPNAFPSRDRAANKHSFEFNPKKTAKIKDLGGGMDFVVNKARALKKAGYLTKAEYEEVVHPKVGAGIAKLYRILRKKGYDAIEYKNKVEGKGTSYEVLDISKLDTEFGKTTDMNLGNLPLKPDPRLRENAKHIAKQRGRLKSMEEVERELRHERVQSALKSLRRTRDE
jgi:hypothetical protein